MLPIISSIRAQQKHAVRRDSSYRFCKHGNHPFLKCTKFNNSDVRKRYDFIKETHMCFKCLKNYKNPCQNNSNCTTCGKRHNSHLHLPALNNELSCDRMMPSTADASACPSQQVVPAMSSKTESDFQVNKKQNFFNLEFNTSQTFIALSSCSK